MEFLSLNLRTFKKVFFQCLTINILIIAASYTSMILGLPYLLPVHLTRNFTSFFLIIMIIPAVVYTQRLKKDLAGLDEITDFEEKAMRYEKIYKNRLYWFLFSCIISCVLYVLSSRSIFLFYAVFDLAITFPYYPNKAVFQRELKSDEIIFY